LDNPARGVGDCRIGDAQLERVALLKAVSETGQARSSASTNWRAASAAFREAIRADKQKETEAFPTLVQCSHCSKKFHEKAAARHELSCDRQESRSSPSKWRGRSLHLRMQLREAKESYLSNAIINHWQEAMVQEC
jgi:hypothetical protein